MKSKIIIPAQFFGAGDAIFIMTLLRELAKDEYKILYPIMPHLVEGFNRAYSDVTFIPFTMIWIDYNEKKIIENEYYKYLPIRWADSILGLPYTSCMSAKYSLFNMDYKKWKDNAHYERDLEREQKLFSEVLGIGENERYNLVNEYFGTSSQWKAPIKIENEYRNIEMKTIQGFSLFDWSLVIQNATNIHVANSSIIYLLELLDLKAEEIHLYNRVGQETNFDNTIYLHTKPYILHY